LSWSFVVEEPRSSERAPFAPTERIDPETVGSEVSDGVCARAGLATVAARSARGVVDWAWSSALSKALRFSLSAGSETGTEGALATMLLPFDSTLVNEVLALMSCS
jgi:hypothetical protein